MSRKCPCCPDSFIVFLIVYLSQDPNNVCMLLLMRTLFFMGRKNNLVWDDGGMMERNSLLKKRNVRKACLTYNKIPLGERVRELMNLRRIYV